MTRAQQREQSPERRGPIDGEGEPAPASSDWAFYRRVGVGAAIVVGIVAVALFLWYAMYVLLLGFAAVLVAVMLRGLAEWLSAKTGLSDRWALGVVLLALVVAGAGLGWFTATRLSRRVGELAERLPQTIRSAEDRLRNYAWGRAVLNAAGGSDGPASSPPSVARRPGDGASPARDAFESPPNAESLTPEAAIAVSAPAAAMANANAAAASQPSTRPSTRPSALVKAVTEAAGQGSAGGAAGGGIGRWFNWLLQGVIGVVVFFAAGIYLAASPRLYTSGLLHLVPKPHRATVADLMCKVAFVLRHWMLGQLVPMAAIGALTAVGLKLIGVEMWLTIGLLAALFNFIPNFGPLVSFVPAFLLALAADPTKALWVIVLWVVAQSLEGYVLTPLVQRRAVELPPALTILVQVLMGLLLGTLGVILAAPLAAAGMVVVQTLWVREALGDPVRTPDEEAEEGERGRRGEGETGR